MSKEVKHAGWFPALRPLLPVQTAFPLAWQQSTLVCETPLRVKKLLRMLGMMGRFWIEDDAGCEVM